MRLPSQTPRSRESSRLHRVRVLPELLAIRNERAAAAISAPPLGSALDIVNEHEGHAPAADAADAADRRNDLHRTVVGSVPEKHTRSAETAPPT
jgi:hypothetical protein